MGINPRVHSRRVGRGRHANRNSASLQGAMSSWLRSVVSRREADTQLERSAERALDLYHNDAMAHGVLESLLVEAVGIGLTPQPAPKTEWMGRDAQWEADFQAAALRVWEEWGLDCRHWCDATRRQNYYGLQGLSYLNWKLLGLGVNQVIAKPRPGAPLSTCLLPIDPFRVVTPTDASAASEIYDGVEVDRDGEPTHVWIRKPNVSGLRPRSGDCKRLPVWDEVTGLPRLLLVSDVRNIAEYRQDSILGPMISEIRHSNDLAEAAVVGAMVRNMYTMFVQDFGQGTISKSTPWDQRVVNTENGQILLGSGKEKPTFFQHDAAPSRYSEMFGAIVDRLGMATGRGAENVSRKYQASYSASKASMEKADQFNESEHRILNDRFSQPAWAWMLYEASLRGRLPLSRKEFLDNLHACTACEHLPQPFRQIDREKAAKADVLELANNTTTRRELFGRKGRDWRDQLRQAAIEKKFIRELEAEYGVSLSASDQATASTESDDKEPDDKEADDES
ncbi:phage portal protein [Desulfovibrio oxyclinae]|uniref:phage portal protein n=1 Tax=Desulfovibrio oxyclinae TaxID=63560 RepID=UPI00037F46A1|nr:phage portal protein [Desulfovibrio oxyclinae]